jgi:hypothetical protein
VQAHVLALHAPTLGEVIENAGHGQQRVTTGCGRKENTSSVPKYRVLNGSKFMPKYKVLE